MNSLLSAIKAFVLKNRPAYKDYLGKETKTVNAKIVYIDSSSMRGQIVDSSFTAFVLGKEYEVTIDNESKKYTASQITVNGNTLVGLEDTSWQVSVIESGYADIVWSSDEFSFTTMTISQYNTVTEYKYDIKKLPNECVPDEVNGSIKKAQNTAYAARSKANSAYSHADSAYSLANTANTAVNTAKTKADSAYSLANTANTAANTAKTNADSAYSLANTAKTTANNALPKSGGTMTGSLILKSDPTADKEAATKKYVDDKTGVLLPTVSSSDNGKFLRVVDGTWSASPISNAEEASF